MSDLISGSTHFTDGFDQLEPTHSIKCDLTLMAGVGIEARSILTVDSLKPFVVLIVFLFNCFSCLVELIRFYPENVCRSAAPDTNIIELILTLHFDCVPVYGCRLLVISLCVYVCVW